MKISRREALSASGIVLTGLSVGLKPTLARAEQAAQSVPDHLVDSPAREWAELPLLPDGSAREYAAGDIVTITEPTRWRTPEPPQIESDYRRLNVKVTGGGTTTRSGTMTLADLEPLPRRSHIFLLQCGAPNPRGIVKWTGVSFSDVATMLGVQPAAHYCRIVAADGMSSVENMNTLRHPQVMLAWMLNDGPLPTKHGAPLRLVIPFRYGIRSVKSIAEIAFGITPTAPPT
jgi:DMSO/TMAO reductase YedYZ molybdopterin-dependent catalytic subunit